MLYVQANEEDETKRRVIFHLVETDGITSADNEAGGQPQISVNEDSWTSTGISVITNIGYGRYWAELDQTVIATPGTKIETRYKSLNTAECPGDSVEVVAYDPTTNSTAQSGSGADEVTLTFTKEGGAFIADADVWITSDAEGTNVVAGTLQTDSNGEVTFLLDAGDTYFAFLQKDGVNSIRGEEFVAEAD